MKLPEKLDTPVFQEIWQDWTGHRKEIRHPLKPTTIKYQMRKLVTMGHERAIAAITHSIEQGYQGIFEPMNGKTPDQERRHQQVSEAHRKAVEAQQAHDRLQDAEARQEAVSGEDRAAALRRLRGGGA